MGAQWLSGRVLESRPRGCGFEPHWRHYVVSLSKHINPSLVLVQPRKTRPYITEILLMEQKESNQTNSSQSVYRCVYTHAKLCSRFIFDCECLPGMLTVYVGQHVVMLQLVARLKRTHAIISNLL